MNDSETAAAPVMFHICLNVSDLDRAVNYYRTLFDRAPLKHHADYAKFELTEPPLVLSLKPSPHLHGGSLNHLGFRVPNAEVLVEFQRRLEKAGYRTRRQDGVECCYAHQTKFWAADPDSNLWEVYVLHGDIDHKGGSHGWAGMSAPLGALGLVGMVRRGLGKARAKLHCLLSRGCTTRGEAPALAAEPPSTSTPTA
jgi:catechol 2,3-dioxygenase-like lactoylglutathione lyase family enzyme